MIKFGEKLKELRIDKKLSQKELAEILVVDQRTISNWEKEFRQPSFEMLVLIAKYFQVTTDYLLGLED
jgi:transcriptional regulator with XRE-family HTH domain